MQIDLDWKQEETSNYLIEEINQNGTISEKHKTFCVTLN